MSNRHQRPYALSQPTHSEAAIAVLAHRENADDRSQAGRVHVWNSGHIDDYRLGGFLAGSCLKIEESSNG